MNRERESQKAYRENIFNKVTRFCFVFTQAVLTAGPLVFLLVYKYWLLRTIINIGKLIQYE